MWYGLAVLLAGLIATPLAIAVLRHFQVVDVPNHRSSHHHVTVRGAGIGVALVGVAVLVVASTREQPEIGLVAAAAATLSAIGLVDDLMDLSIRYRLPLQAVIAVLVVALTGPGQGFGGFDLALGSVAVVAVAVAAVVGIVGYVNAFNFMDGINGISSLHAGAVGVTWLIAGVPADRPAATLLGSVTVACAAAFLPFNFPRARAFLGDVGSYFFGGLIAVSAVVLLGEVPLPVIVVPLVPYVADTTWTLLRRVRRGEVWHEAHREHVYQRLLEVGWSHAQSASLVGGLTLFGGISALAAYYVIDGLLFASFSLLPFILATAAYLALPQYLELRSRRTAGAA